MHILMFSYDKTLVDGNQIGDTLLRHQRYAEYLNRLDILVPAPATKRQPEIKVNEKLTIYPSYGSRILSWFRAYLKARRICQKSKVDIIVTQDALLGFLGVLLRKEFGGKLQRHGLRQRQQERPGLEEVVLQPPESLADVVLIELDREADLLQRFEVSLDRAFADAELTRQVP